jgi:NAD-reducing hydrogenase small subunit
MTRPRLATVWLGGCSGCHMSFLDLDEWLFDLIDRADVVYGPLTDAKSFPRDVDITLVEGAVANEDNLEMAHEIRRNTRLVVSFGDWAVTGNVTALRNVLGDPEPMLRRVYVDGPDGGGAIPEARGILPALLPRVRPLHEVIHVDVHLQGCPPPAQRIRVLLEQLLDGQAGPVPRNRFG